MQRGFGLLNSLFGDGMISGIANAISRYSGINFDAAKKLLAFLMPMVLGKVAAQWRSQGGTVGALTSLFADQKRNIADAVPAGFSLADIPGLAGAGEAVRDTATHTTRRATETAEAATGSARELAAAAGRAARRRIVALELPQAAGGRATCGSGCES